MNTLIITNKPWKFKANPSTTINSQSRYEDSKHSIRQHRWHSPLIGIRVSNVILYEPKILKHIDKLRMLQWIMRRVIFSTTRDATYTYTKQGAVVFQGNCEEFVGYIKEGLENTNEF